MKKIMIVLLSLPITANLAAWELAIRNHTQDPLEATIYYGSKRKCGEEQLKEERGAAEDKIQIPAGSKTKPEIKRYTHRCCINWIDVKKKSGEGKNKVYSFAPIYDAGLGLSCRSSIINVSEFPDHSLLIEKGFKNNVEKILYQNGPVLVVDNKTNKYLHVQYTNRVWGQAVCEEEQFGVKPNSEKTYTRAGRRVSKYYPLATAKCRMKEIHIRTADDKEPSGDGEHKVRLIYAGKRYKIKVTQNPSGSLLIDKVRF